MFIKNASLGGAFSIKMLPRGSIFTENATLGEAFSMKMLPLVSIFDENASQGSVFSEDAIPGGRVSIENVLEIHCKRSVFFRIFAKEYSIFLVKY